MIIIPVKPLHRAKERLASVLEPQQRRRLCLAMLQDVCAAAVAAAPVWVITSDESAAEVARSQGAEPRLDPTPLAGLNPSLEAVTPHDIQGILILSADLPAVSPEDVRAVAQGYGVTLATDRRGGGTNALWRSPPHVIPLAFGDGSRLRHERLAGSRGVPFRSISRAGLALDIDLPEDLALACEASVGPATRDELRRLGLPERLRAGRSSAD